MTVSSGDELIGAIPIGRRLPGRGRTITAGEISLLAAVSAWGDPRQTVDRAIDVDSASLDPHLVLAVVVALAAANPIFAQLETEHGLVTVAALRHNAVLGAPVTAGTTIVADTEIVAARSASSKPGHVILTVRDQGTDARGQMVVRIERVLLMRREARPSCGGMEEEAT